MCLIGPPSSLKRRLAIRFCELRGLVYQYVSLNRDTSASDLRQRRELSGGTATLEMGPVLTAAVNGDVLILDGLGKVEPNLLPLINELLESRQMVIFLVAVSFVQTVRACRNWTTGFCCPAKPTIVWMTPARPIRVCCAATRIFASFRRSLRRLVLTPACHVC